MLKSFSRPVLFLAVWGLLAVMAHADRADQIMQILSDEGYEEIAIKKTWLGRLHITAKGDEYDREIVVDPRNGDVMRDTMRAKRQTGSPRKEMEDGDRPPPRSNDGERHREAPPPDGAGTKPGPQDKGRARREDPR